MSDRTGQESAFGLIKVNSLYFLHKKLSFTNENTYLQCFSYISEECFPIINIKWNKSNPTSPAASLITSPLPPKSAAYPVHQYQLRSARGFVPSPTLQMRVTVFPNTPLCLQNMKCKRKLKDCPMTEIHLSIVFGNEQNKRKRTSYENENKETNNNVL